MNIIKKVYLVLGVAGCFLLTSCGIMTGLVKTYSPMTPQPSETTSGENTQAPFEDMQIFILNYTDPMAGSFSLTLEATQEGEHLEFETYFGEHIKADAIITQSLFEKLAELCEKYDVYSWDGFSVSAPEGLLDASNVSLEIKLSNGEWVSVSGYNGPENFWDFYDEVEELAISVAKEYSID